MIKQTLFFSTPVYLSLKNCQIVISWKDSDDKMRVCHKSMAHPLLCYLLYNPRSIVAYSKKGII